MLCPSLRRNSSGPDLPRYIFRTWTVRKGWQTHKQGWPKSLLPLTFDPWSHPGSTRFKARRLVETKASPVRWTGGALKHTRFHRWPTTAATYKQYHTKAWLFIPRWPAADPVWHFRGASKHVSAEDPLLSAFCPVKRWSAATYPQLRSGAWVFPSRLLNSMLAETQEGCTYPRPVCKLWFKVRG